MSDVETSVDAEALTNDRAGYLSRIKVNTDRKLS